MVLMHGKIKETAKLMRQKILNVSHYCNLSTHLGGGLSMVEIMATLYSEILKFDTKNPRWEGRDRFILSKGHGVLGYFSALVAVGIISDEIFNTFQSNESDLIAHPVMNMDLGIESSNGSLGQGLSMSVGIAYSAKKKQKDFHTFVLMGDGECNEGSVWEAVMSAVQLKLDNLTVVIDYNKLQSDGKSSEIIDLGKLGQKFLSFGCNVIEVDGHNIQEILDAFKNNNINGTPKVIVANTIKGKGISFMENNNEWHHNRLTKTSYDLAILEIEN